MWYFERLVCPFHSARRHGEFIVRQVLCSLSFIDRVLRLPCGLPCEVGKSCTCKRRRSVVCSHMGVPGKDLVCIGALLYKPFCTDGVRRVWQLSLMNPRSKRAGGRNYRLESSLIDTYHVLSYRHNVSDPHFSLDVPRTLTLFSYYTPFVGPLF